MPKAADVRAELASRATAQRAEVSRRFFKTAKGQYGEGDVFIGVTVPDQRKIAQTFATLPLPQVLQLLRSKVHEERLTALLILVRQYERADVKLQGTIANVYLANAKHVNNWDLVDSSAPNILGHWLLNKDRQLLVKLAGSKLIWERRIAMLATHTFIRNGEHKDAFAIATLLLKDEHDLMHKAVGWMLREVGKRVGLVQLRQFLKSHAIQMPRTTLRYAIEDLAPEERQRWMRREQ